jgi:hypothetical protein
VFVTSNITLGTPIASPSRLCSFHVPQPTGAAVAVLRSPVITTVLMIDTSMVIATVFVVENTAATAGDGAEQDHLDLRTEIS